MGFFLPGGLRWFAQRAHTDVNCATEDAPMNDHVQHAQARREACDWYTDYPPTPDVARRHFVLLKKQHPEKAALYDEALSIFLATCSGIKRYP